MTGSTNPCSLGLWFVTPCFHATWRPAPFFNCDKAQTYRCCVKSIHCPISASPKKSLIHGQIDSYSGKTQKRPFEKADKKKSKRPKNFRSFFKKPSPLFLKHQVWQWHLIYRLWKAMFLSSVCSGPHAYCSLSTRNNIVLLLYLNISFCGHFTLWKCMTQLWNNKSQIVDLNKIRRRGGKFQRIFLRFLTQVCY